MRLRQVQLGVTVAIDDFGTGYSSLSRLSQLRPRDSRSTGLFVADLTTSPKSLAIVRAIVAPAEAVDLEVVAEGVETADQAMVLVTEGVRLAQGYWYS
ncbi:MAG: EAL domain-containing protein [Candidatus Nanopelagicales bacterium]